MRDVAGIRNLILELIFMNVYILNCFRAHPVSNIGPHSTLYALIVSFTYVHWPEDGLKKD